MVRLLKSVFLTTAIIELAGTAIGYISFSRDHAPLDALGISLFHAVASFNNAGFDILGNMQNLIPYADDVLLNLNTCAMIFFGGIGFPVILDGGARTAEVAQNVDARARGDFNERGSAGVGRGSSQIHGRIFMAEGGAFQLFDAHGGLFDGAAFELYAGGTDGGDGADVRRRVAGSTGGGVKTTTLFALLQGLKSAATNRSERAFHYSLPKDAFRKAATICAMSILVIGTGTFLLLVFEKGLAISDAMFEMVSAFGTVGLSTGITPTLSTAGKLLSILVMFIGRLGPMTVATLWYFSRGERIAYPEGNISIG